MRTITPTYNAQITAGSLLLRESREVAKLLLQDATQETWRQALVVDNVLQKSSPASARRMARLLINRLEDMPRELWQLVVDGNNDVALQALLAGAIKHSRLLGDFMLSVLRRHYREFNHPIQAREWSDFLRECSLVDPAVALWSETTRRKVGQVVFRILAEAGYLQDTKSLRLTPVIIAPEVSRILTLHHEDYINKCMEIAHE